MRANAHTSAISPAAAKRRQPRRLYCPADECTVTYLEKKVLVGHMKKQHPDNYPNLLASFELIYGELNPAPVRFYCTVERCRRFYITQPKLEAHMRARHGKSHRIVAKVNEEKEEDDGENNNEDKEIAENEDDDED